MNAIVRAARSAVALVVAACIGLSAHAQSFPQRPIKLLVGYTPGGSVDAGARMLAAQLAPLLGQPVVVENRPGASGMIAADAVAKSPADGYALVMVDSAVLIKSQLQPRDDLDPLKSFAPVAGAFIVPLMVIAPMQLEASTPQELIALLKANPGKYSYATAGVGTVQHLGMEMLQAKTGTRVVHVPYKGAAPIISDVMGNQIPLGIVSVVSGLPQVTGKKAKAIGILNAGKAPGAEFIPSFADAVAGFDVATRLMVLAPAGTPEAVVNKRSDAVRTALASNDIVSAAAGQGLVPAFLTPAQLGETMKRESAGWATVIKEQKITAD